MNETVVEIYNLKTNTRNYSFKVLNETKVVMYRGMLRSHKTHVTPPVSSKEPLAFSCFFSSFICVRVKCDARFP